MLKNTVTNFLFPFQRFILVKFFEKATSPEIGPELQNILLKLCSLYGAWSLEQHLTILYQGGYASGSEPAQFIKDGILKLCAQIKPEAVSLVDALAPPDFILNSALGKSDGNIYKNIQSAVFQGPGVFQRPTWWQDIVFWKSNIVSKL